MAFLHSLRSLDWKRSMDASGRTKIGADGDAEFQLSPGTSLGLGLGGAGLSYMFFKGPPHWKTKHPVWGTIFALGAIVNTSQGVAGLVEKKKVA